MDFFDEESKKFILPKLPYDYGFLEGISEQTDRYHHDTHFQVFIDALNKLDGKAKEMRASGDFSNIRNLMLSLSHNMSGAYLHNLFFSILGGDGKMFPDLAVVQKIMEDFGTLEKWRVEFTASAKVSRGWAILGLIEENKTLCHYMVDLNDLQTVFGISPILVIDVWEHAYYFDYGPDRESYINAFIQNVDWKKVNEIYLKV